LTVVDAHNVAMLRTIRTAFGKNVSMVFGGFHLLEKSEQEPGAIIADMKALGVERCDAAGRRGRVNAGRGSSWRSCSQCCPPAC
jgi:hypothetical protein